MCVTSTPARTSRCVAASRAHAWATCASAVGTSLGSTVSTGEIQGRTVAFGPGSILASHPGYVTRDFSVPSSSLELLTGGRTRPGEFGCCNIKDISLPRIDQQCPKGWWGNPTCGPCNCDVNKGFDPDCNKTNGQCHCKVRDSCANGDMDHGFSETLLVLDAVPCPPTKAWQLPRSCFVCPYLGWIPAQLLCTAFLDQHGDDGGSGVLENQECLDLLWLQGFPSQPCCCPIGLSDDCPHLFAGLPLPPQRQ